MLSSKETRAQEYHDLVGHPFWSQADLDRVGTDNLTRALSGLLAECIQKRSISFYSPD